MLAPRRLRISAHFVVWEASPPTHPHTHTRTRTRTLLHQMSGKVHCLTATASIGYCRGYLTWCALPPPPGCAQPGAARNLIACFPSPLPSLNRDIYCRVSTETEPRRRQNVPSYHHLPTRKPACQRGWATQRFPLCCAWVLSLGWWL
jgi:hypothetical protein